MTHKEKGNQDFFEYLGLVFHAESISITNSDKAPSVDFLGHSMVSCWHTVIVL